MNSAPFCMSPSALEHPSAKVWGLLSCGVRFTQKQRLLVALGRLFLQRTTGDWSILTACVSKMSAVIFRESTRLKKSHNARKVGVGTSSLAQERSEMTQILDDHSDHREGQ